MGVKVLTGLAAGGEHCALGYALAFLAQEALEVVLIVRLPALALAHDLAALVLNQIRLSKSTARLLADSVPDL